MLACAALRGRPLKRNSLREHLPPIARPSSRRSALKVSPFYTSDRGFLKRTLTADVYFMIEWTEYCTPIHIPAICVDTVERRRHRIEPGAFRHSSCCARRVTRDVWLSVWE